jgi:hypothetical protein
MALGRIILYIVSEFERVRISKRAMKRTNPDSAPFYLFSFQITQLIYAGTPLGVGISGIILSFFLFLLLFFQRNASCLLTTGGSVFVFQHLWFKSPQARLITLVSNLLPHQNKTL